MFNHLKKNIFHYVVYAFLGSLLFSMSFSLGGASAAEDQMGIYRDLACQDKEALVNYVNNLERPQWLNKFQEEVRAEAWTQVKIKVVGDCFIDNEEITASTLGG